MFFLLRFSEAEFFTSLIFKRFLSNIWSWACENWSESLRTDSVAVRVKYSDKVWGFSNFSFCTPPGDIYGRPLLRTITESFKSSLSAIESHLSDFNSSEMWSYFRRPRIILPAQIWTNFNLVLEVLLRTVEQYNNLLKTNA